MSAEIFRWRPALVRTAILIWSVVATAGPAPAAGFRTEGNRMLGPDGSELVLKGLNYAGFQQGSMNPRAPKWAEPYNAPSNLWEQNWRQQLTAIRALGFNALRIPLSPDTLYQSRTIDRYNASLVVKNPDLRGKRPIEVLDAVLAECQRLGLYVLLDMHQTSGIERNPTPYILDADYARIHTFNGQPYTVDDWLRDLSLLATRYRDNPYFVGIDIFNEPHWHLRWDRGDALFDAQAVKEPAKFGYWKDLVERAANAIHAVNPDILIFVEGMDNSYDVPPPRPDLWTGWSESFARLAHEEIDRGRADYMRWPRNRIVLSPHSYGPDVSAAVGQFPPKFEPANGFPGNLADQWEYLFGRLADRYPIVHGEFGGKLGAGPTGARDRQWHDAFVAYLNGKGIRSGFYWSYRNSADTVEVVDSGFRVVSPALMEVLARLWSGGTRGAAALPEGPVVAGQTAPPRAPSAGTPALPAASASAPAKPGTATVATVPVLVDLTGQHNEDRPLAGQRLDRPTLAYIYVRTTLPAASAAFFLDGAPVNTDTVNELPGVFDYSSSYVPLSFWNFALGTRTIRVELRDATGGVIGRGEARFVVGPPSPRQS